MAVIGRFFLCFGLITTYFVFCSGQEKVQKPTFPDVFQVEVQGIFKDEKTEVDGSLYYDKLNNRAAMFYTYQGENTKFIYKFNEDELLIIKGTECQTSEIPTGTFIPFEVDKNGKKIIAKPEEILFFTNSTLDRQELFVFPSYIYTAKIDIPMYSLVNCNVTHIFSKPEMELPDCDGHNCRPTIVAINVKCFGPGEKDEIDHTYNFFRLRSSISDPNAFIPPAGVYCDMKSQQPFPQLPAYFSFSYDLIDEQEQTGENPGVFAVHKKVWYDSKLKLIRMDEFDDDGILIASRIFDIYGGVAYTSVATLAVCNKGPIVEDVALDEMTRLPKVLFLEKATLDDAVYSGTRKVHGLDYEVWSLSSNDKQTEATIVQEFYFTKNEIIGGDATKLKISHVEIYTYEQNELSLFTFLSINNLISKTRWEAFDVSQCFKAEQKKAFKLKVEGPSTVKDSKTYQEILERLYLRLIIATNVSVIRISEVTCVFDGVEIVGFTGWILEKTNVSGSKTGKEEPDMNETYKLIKDAAAAGKLTITMNKDGIEKKYNVTEVEEVHPKEVVPPETKPGTPKDSYSGGTLAGVALALFVVGILLGITGYYVFLKKRKPAPDHLELMNSMKG